MANEARFEVYRGDSIHGIGTGRWHWRFRAEDGSVQANGNKIYACREDAHRAADLFAKTILSGFGAAPIDVPYQGPPILDIDE